MKGTDGFPIRLRFAKRGKVRFVSHRDVARAFERAFRIEQLPLAFTQGFSPRPKVSFGLALAVAYESDAEYLDLELAEERDVDALPALLGDPLPTGLSVSGAAALVDRAPSLQESVTSVEYRIGLAGLAGDELAALVEQVQASTALPVTTTRKGRDVIEDVRPAISRITVVSDAPPVFCGSGEIDLEVATKPRGARPSEVITALRELASVVEPPGEDRVLRTCQWIERDGERHEPLVADRRLPAPVGAGAPALEACA